MHRRIDVAAAEDDTCFRTRTSQVFRYISPRAWFIPRAGSSLSFGVRCPHSMSHTGATVSRVCVCVPALSGADSAVGLFL